MALGGRFLQDMLKAESEGRPFLWGNIANMSNSFVNKVGLSNAFREVREPYVSEHRASSGMSNRMTRKERKAHYVRKGILEREKEEARRRKFKYYNPDASESKWLAQEAARKNRKAAERATRKAGKRRGSRSSSKRNSRRH